MAPPAPLQGAAAGCGILMECLRRALQRDSGDGTTSTGRQSLSLQYYNTSALLVAAVSRAGCAARLSPPPPRTASGRSFHGSHWTAAPFEDFTMKTGVFLLLLAAFTCGLTLGEQDAVEELQVETLVSETRIVM